MKSKHLLFLVLITFTAVSCGDDEDDSPVPTVEDTAVYFRCKLNGRDFINDIRYADYLLGTARVVAYNDEELIRLNMSKDTIGTFSINLANPENEIIFNDSLQRRYVSISGSITITQFDKTKQLASGTFSGVLEEETNTSNKLTITEGKFNRILLEPF